MTSAEKEPAAVKLPFETGEYLCTWDVPDGSGGMREVSGLLTVEQGHYPNGMLYGNMPIDWQEQGKGQKFATFPQTHRFDSLVGRLSTGAYVALLNGELSYWFDTQGRARGAIAVLSQDKFDASAHRKYASIEIQVEGLEAVAGVAPISKTKFPVDKDAERTWAATLNDEAKFEWATEEHQMSFWYNGSFRSFDAYEFRMVFGPVLRVTSQQPLTVVEWWLNWVRPLRQMISLVTSAPREIRYFLALNDGDPEHSQRDQVFGWDITHQPVNSTRAVVDEIRSSVKLKEDELSLLALLTKWQELAAIHHPLIETYGSMTTAKEQHPRSRFLLLLQALEGSHGFENKASHEKDREKHTKARQAFIDRVAELLEAKDLKFLDKYLMKSPPQGLEQSLIAIFKSLPVDVVPELEKTELVAQMRAEHSGKGKLRVEAALVRARNVLSHGSSSFDPNALEETAKILDRVVRSEAIRLLGAPSAARERALKKPE